MRASFLSLELHPDFLARFETSKRVKILTRSANRGRREYVKVVCCLYLLGETTGPKKCKII